MMKRSAGQCTTYDENGKRRQRQRHEAEQQKVEEPAAQRLAISR
jgi:hypothetical protein